MRMNYMAAMAAMMTSQIIGDSPKDDGQRVNTVFKPHPIFSIRSALNKKGELKKPFHHNPRNNRKTKPAKKVKK